MAPAEATKTRARPKKTNEWTSSSTQETNILHIQRIDTSPQQMYVPVVKPD